LEETGIEPYAFDTVSQTSSIGASNLIPKTQSGSSFLMATADCMKPATTEQIQEMFGKVAESKGYVEGAKVKCLFDGRVQTLICFDELDFNSDVNGWDNIWWEDYKSELILIYYNGKWAEIIKEEPKSETLVLKGVRVGTSGVLEDLELTAAHLEQLKECLSNKM
jgi:hypothetical protein